MASDEATTEVLDDRFVQKAFPVLHRAAWKLTGDPIAAEDLAQETLVTALEKWDAFDGRSSRLTWIHGILIRKTRKHFRSLARLRRAVDRYLSLEPPAEAEASSDESLARSEWESSVWAKVATLPRQQAEAILLYYGQQMTYEQTAQALGCATGTAKTRVHHGLKRLRESHSVSALSDQ